jgi:hypothetical protein
MKQETKETIYIAILTVIIVYYLLRLFTFLYMFNDIHPIDDTYIKTRPVIEQGHLRAEQLRSLENGKSNKK